ncbi:unnamed protein product [Penicillium camemberti]|uniref:Str. FM013 n=1 Tax=Penicillium camemberti (strain FM 013) TaxID=1429867 RepID=A0A0G4PNR6_PENC3|nr:unnamed protein product [Penicillium camemberti]
MMALELSSYLWIKFLWVPFISPVEYNRGSSSPTDGSTEKKNARNERKGPSAT